MAHKPKDNTLRSPFGEAEAPNQARLLSWSVTAEWQSPFGAAEDRNDLETIGIGSETDMMVAHQGDQDRNPAPSDGLEPPASWRSSFGTT
ncbi:hypothetical protein [Streptomyces sp. NPDC001930]|uniref:hypothetical protein n=1 Tax=Streptomyces sp. NPDC001930 TaxID=3364625 RepID=UPI0036919BE2